MKNKFVEGLSNVTRFLEATRRVDTRGSLEASWHLVTGEPGFGKSGTLGWYAVKEKAIFIRAKAGWTPHWLLADLADALDITSSYNTTEKLFFAVMPEIMKRYHDDGTRLIVDEIDHAARNVKVIEQLRDLTDAAMMPLIAAGMGGAERMMKRYPQIYSRIADVTQFGPASVEDVHLVCGELSEVRIAKDLATEIQRRTGGRLRSVKNAIGRVEYTMRKHRGETITLADWGNRPLTNEDRTPALRLVSEAANG